MRYIWICVIDSCIIRSGQVQPHETTPLLFEKIQRCFPHMGPDSLKVVDEDGKIYDSQLWFPGPVTNHVEQPEGDDALVAVGVVDNFIGLKIHRGISVEELIQTEARSFSGRITDEVDFGIFDFQGDQLASIEDMIAFLQANEPDKLTPQDKQSKKPHHRARRRPPNPHSSPAPQAPSENTPQAAPARQENAVPKPEAPQLSLPPPPPLPTAESIPDPGI